MTVADVAYKFVLLAKETLELFMKRFCTIINTLWELISFVASLKLHFAIGIICPEVSARDKIDN